MKITFYRFIIEKFNKYLCYFYTHGIVFLRSITKHSNIIFLGRTNVTKTIVLFK